MKWISRLNLSENQTPIRVYIHAAGLEHAYGSIQAARAYARVLFEEEKRFLQEYDFALALLWGQEGSKMADFFGFSDMEPWPGNPDIEGWVLKDGNIYQREDQRMITCGEGIMLIGGIEEPYRRQCPDLETYLNVPPKIKELE